MKHILTGRLRVLCITFATLVAIFSSYSKVHSCSGPRKDTDKFIYKRGDAVSHVFKNITKIANGPDFETGSDFAMNTPEVKRFTTYKHYHAWAAYLIKYARDLRIRLDDIERNLQKLGDSWSIHHTSQSLIPLVSHCL